jgi:hypothetical protein
MHSALDAARARSFSDHLAIFGTCIIVAKCNLPSVELCGIFNEQDYTSDFKDSHASIRQKSFDVEFRTVDLSPFGFLDKNDYIVFEDQRFIVSHLKSSENGKHVYALNIADSLSKNQSVGVAF